MTDSDFLAEQARLRQEVADGDKCWADVSRFRENNGRVPYTNDSLRRYFGFYDELRAAGWKIEQNSNDVPSYRETTEINSKGEKTSDKLIELFECDKDNPDALLKAHGYSSAAFELISAKSSVWSGVSKQGDKTLYASRIVVKPKAMVLDPKEIAEHFIELAMKAPCDYTPTYTSYEENGKCLVPCFYDIHFGRLAWWGETGENYDYKIARQRILDGVSYYCDKYKNEKFEKIIFVIGQDFFNSASNGFTTSGRHEQDNDTRFQKIFEKGTEALIEAIQIFAKMAPVEVVLCQGNHSFYEEYYCACVVEAFFHENNRVTVDKTPHTRKYRKFGKTLLGFTHGSEEKDRIFGLMQCEAAEDWASTSQHIWLTGHYHDLALKNKNGVYVWTIPSFVSPDAWTAKSGYTNSIKQTMAFVFDKELGMTDISFRGV